MTTTDKLAQALRDCLKAMDIARDAIQPITVAQMKLHRLNPDTDRLLDAAAANALAALAEYDAAPQAAPAGPGQHKYPSFEQWAAESMPFALDKHDASDDGGRLATTCARMAFAAGRAMTAAPPQAASGSAAVECHGLDTPERVRFYEHDFYVLSNFSAFRVTFDGQTFDTSEAAYHYQRFTDSADGRWILYAYSAHDAFRYAQDNKGRQRWNWDEIKVGIMRDILRAKAAQHEYVRRKLLATGDRELVEDSWRDDFWGWGPNRDGQNMLGKLWMEVRAELRAAASGCSQGARSDGGAA